MTPRGMPLTQARVATLSRGPGAVILCARFEGVDERIIEARNFSEISIGDYVLSGGELPALVVIDAVARLLPGVLGHDESAEQDSFGDGLLDWPHYTRPENWEGRPVPAVLQGGNHAAIRRWRLMQALGRTWRLRPDLLRLRSLTQDERALLEEYCAGAGIEPPR